MISFKGRHFEKDLILMAARWHTSYSISYRDIEEMLLERDLPVDHSTINRWVIEYSPLLEKEFRKKHKRKINDSWRMDETYIVTIQHNPARILPKPGLRACQA